MGIKDNSEIEQLQRGLEAFLEKELKLGENPQEQEDAGEEKILEDGKEEEIPEDGGEEEIRENAGEEGLLEEYERIGGLCLEEEERAGRPHKRDRLQVIGQGTEWFAEGPRTRRGRPGPAKSSRHGPGSVRRQPGRAPVRTGYQGYAGQGQESEEEWYSEEGDSQEELYPQEGSLREEERYPQEESPREEEWYPQEESPREEERYSQEGSPREEERYPQEESPREEEWYSQEESPREEWYSQEGSLREEEWYSQEESPREEEWYSQEGSPQEEEWYSQKGRSHEAERYPGGKKDPGAGKVPGREKVPGAGKVPGREKVPGGEKVPGAGKVLGGEKVPGAGKVPVRKKGSGGEKRDAGITGQKQGRGLAEQEESQMAKKESKSKKSTKKKPRKKKSLLLRLLVICCVIVALLGFGLYHMVGSVYGKMTFQGIEAVASQPMEEEGVVNILLIGNDSRKNGSDGRSDAMILVSISNRTKTIYMTSILRDIYVDIPGREGNRLNAAYSFGGPELLMETIEKNFDISVNRYVSVNFEAFANLIDAVGGVDLELSSEEIEYVNGYLVEYNMLTGREQGTDNMDPAASGMVHLNGPQALAYSRNRYIGTDFGRTERQRKVLTAAVEKIPSALLDDAEGLMDKVLPNLTTNLTQNECFQLSLMAGKLLTYEIVSDSIPQPGTYKDVTIRKMAVLQVDFEANIKYLKEKIYGETEEGQTKEGQTKEGQ